MMAEMKEEVEDILPRIGVVQRDPPVVMNALLNSLIATMGTITLAEIMLQDLISVALGAMRGEEGEETSLQGTSPPPLILVMFTEVGEVIMEMKGITDDPPLLLFVEEVAVEVVAVQIEVES